MSVCSLTPAGPADLHHHSIVFISLETLLTLLDWQLQLPYGRDPSCPLPSFSSTTTTFGHNTVDTSSVMRPNFLSKHAMDHVLLNVQFEKVLLYVYTHTNYFRAGGNLSILLPPPSRLIFSVIYSLFFFQCVCEHLWRCLSPSCVELHSEAAVLMSWVNSLFAPSSVCEKVILEHFTSQVSVYLYCTCTTIADWESDIHVSQYFSTIHF